LNPRPDKKLGLEYFEKAYSNAKGFEEHSYYRDHEKIFERNNSRFALIKDLPVTNKSILDFGAGQGHFVKVALDNGWAANGIELSAAAIKAARENFNVELFDSLEKLEGKEFGVIALWDVIEHLEDPRGILLALSRHLHPKGFFVVETSNIDSVDFLMKKQNWNYWHVDHLYYYSRQTIQDLFTRLNFKMVSVPGKSGTNAIKRKTIREYIRLLNPAVMQYALRRKLIMSKNKDKNISGNSLMTVVATRV